MFPDKEFYIAVAGKNITKIKTDSCHVYETCEKCMDTTADPLCGWCVYKGSCTTKSGCGEFDPKIRFKEKNKENIDQDRFNFFKKISILFWAVFRLPMVKKIDGKFYAKLVR